MDDLISRKAAIEAVILSDYIKDNDVEGGATLIFEDSIIKRLHELPSAQPVDKDINVPANDLISRQAAIDAVDRAVTKEAARWSLQELPSVQPERKRGRWIYGEDEYGIDGYHCDKCGFFVPWDYTHKFINYIENYHFCPNCGADMRGEEDEDIPMEYYENGGI